MGTFARQVGIVKLLRHVEGAIPSARIGNTSVHPVLWLPAPTGYAVWVAFDKGVYVAFISRRTGKRRMWRKYVGHDRETPRQIWPRVSSWLNSHPELTAAWEEDRRRFSTAGVSPEPAAAPAERASQTSPAAVLNEEGDDLPLGFDPKLVAFFPLSSDSRERVVIDVSREGAAHIRAAAEGLGWDEGAVYEAGALMFLAHTVSQIAIVGGDTAARIESKLSNLLPEYEEPLPAEAFLASVVAASEENGVADRVVSELAERYPPLEFDD